MDPHHDLPTQPLLTWATISGTYDARETVLKRDGTSVVTNSSCAVTSGRWYSPCDGATLGGRLGPRRRPRRAPEECPDLRRLRVDDQQGESFANDLSDPQPVAVTDNVNQSKGDKSPEARQPPLRLRPRGYR